jgi:GNAT superfamily N-acetyltransferase
LVAALEAYCREQGATTIHSEIASDADESLAWALRRGFAVKRERVQAAGLTLTTMPALPEAMLRDVYETDVATSHDHPEYDGHESTYDQWLLRKRVETRPCLYAFALNAGRVAGYSEIFLPAEPGGEAYTEYTCVRREYRGRGVALAVKLLTIEAAIAAGAARMRTNNNPENLPMLKVNEQLGYQMLPAPKVLVKTLP